MPEWGLEGGVGVRDGREREGRAKAREWPIKDEIRNLGVHGSKGTQPKGGRRTSTLRPTVLRGGTGPERFREMPAWHSAAPALPGITLPTAVLFAPPRVRAEGTRPGTFRDVPGRRAWGGPGCFPEGTPPKAARPSEDPPALLRPPGQHRPCVPASSGSPREARPRQNPPPVPGLRSRLQ